jgi:hypothetical protein
MHDDEAPRKRWCRFRVNDAELVLVAVRAQAAHHQTVSDYLRALVGLPAIRPGAPKGNTNRRGKRARDTH